MTGVVVSRRALRCAASAAIQLQDQLTPEPLAVSSSGLTNFSFPLSSAIRIIPLLSMPLILRGARLATTTTCLPTMADGSKCRAIPETMVLFSVPRSTSSFRSLSGNGTHFQVKFSEIIVLDLCFWLSCFFGLFFDRFHWFDQSGF
jgi:hypothetical protein